MSTQDHKLIEALKASKDRLAARAAEAVEAVRQRYRQVSPERADADPLLAMLEEIVQPDLDEKRYLELREGIEGPAAPRAPSRGWVGGVGRG